MIPSWWRRGAAALSSTFHRLQRLLLRQQEQPTGVSLGLILREQRQSLAKSQQEIARSLGVSPSVIEALETEQPLYHNLDQEKGYRRLFLLKYARYLKIDISVYTAQLPAPPQLCHPERHFLRLWKKTKKEERFSTRNVTNLLLGKTPKNYTLSLPWNFLKKAFLFLLLVFLLLFLWNNARNLYRALTSHPQFNQEGILELQPQKNH